MEHFLWTEKYRPKTVRETILPQQMKSIFQKFVDDKNIPNMILYGHAGTGKTTIARAMLEELEADYLIINGSLYGNIDTLRVDIMNFATTASFSGGRKYVILDEADYLNPNSTQPALRNFMEEFSKNCGFILTCNYKSRIIPELHSRCSVIDFIVPADEKAQLELKFFKRTLDILEKENIEYDKTAVAECIHRFFPDWRKSLNELQSYAATGKIDKRVNINKGEENIDFLISFMKEKSLTGVRKWLVDNSDIETSAFYKTLYDFIPKKLSEGSSIASAIIILAEYEYKEAFVANHEINRTAALISLMSECVWL